MNGALDGCGGMSSERRAFLWPATTHVIGAENYGGGDGCNNSVVSADQASVRLRAAELAMLLDGIDWPNARRSQRYHRPASG